MTPNYTYDGQPLLGLDQPLQTSGVGSNSSTAPDYTGIHTGSWGLPDFGLTESLKGESTYQPTTFNFDYSSGIPNQPSSIDLAVNKMVEQGWDRTAAQADITAHPEKITQLLGQNTGDVLGTQSKPDPLQIKRDNISKIATDKGADVALDYATNYADQMSPDQYYAMIDQEAGLSTNFLNEQEAAIRAEQPGLEKNITDQASALKNTAFNRKEDAQSAARRLYSELQQGYRQRFGGASSAGEAAQALTGNEQQRQMAQNNRTYQEAVSQVDLSANQAVQSAQSEFRNRLLQITQNRTQVESEKLAARRQALSDLSQKVFAIQQQRETFKQNIALMQEQARLANNTAVNSLNVNPTSGLTIGGNQTTASGNQGIGTAIGSINKTSSGITKNENPLATGYVSPWLGYTDENKQQSIAY